MTPEQLAEIRARAEAATPGAWVAIAPSLSSARYVDGDFARFVERARTDIPALLDYIEELQWVIRKVGDCIAHPEDTKEVGGTLCAQCMYLVDALTSKPR